MKDENANRLRKEEVMEREYEAVKPKGKINRNMVVFALVATLLSTVGLFFLTVPLGLPLEVGYVAAGIAAVCFVALFFVPSPPSSKEDKIAAYRHSRDQSEWERSEHDAILPTSLDLRASHWND